MIEVAAESGYTWLRPADSPTQIRQAGVPEAELGDGSSKAGEPCPSSSLGLQHNKLRPEDRAVHDWYRFVLSFPPHLVRHYIEKFGLSRTSHVLDPFCGTGTTLVECKKLGTSSEGLEPNPVAFFATQTKLNWAVSPDGLLAHARHIARVALEQLKAEGFSDGADLPLFSRGSNPSGPLRSLPADALRLLLKVSISPVPLHKTLVLLETIHTHWDEQCGSHERLALAKALVNGISNLCFGPEVGVGPLRSDAPVVDLWLEAVRSVAEDLHQVRKLAHVPAVVHQADAREVGRVLRPGSVDAVITSPPYPNEKDYTRTTRLEAVILGFLRTKADLQALKRRLIRSNTRCVYKDDDDEQLVAQNPDIQQLAEEIEARPVAMGKTSGFERLYARVTKLYFGGMARHLAALRTALRPGARLAYLVGDQASYLRVMIRTGWLLAGIALSLGYEVTGLELFRTRRATATGQHLREEALLLRWPGPSRGLYTP